VLPTVQQHQQQQQQLPVSPPRSTVHVHGSAGAASTAAVIAGAAAGASASSVNVRRVSAGRVSVGGDGLRKPRGSTSGSRSSSAPVAAFSSPELALLAAAAAEKVGL
jgi:hypothetical protein